MNNCYGSLSRAQLSFDYLHTNSTTHEFLFGALAELVDNARDASATKIDIFTLEDEMLRGGYILCFLDDGEGMDPTETAEIITFGRSSKRSLDSQQIGMYGNGLKSGSMRIGNDLMLFTKKGLTMSCLFISRSFHEEESIDEVIVPIPSFETTSRRPLASGNKALEKHNMEMGIIFKYSPFHNDEDFFTQFDRIEGNTGTMVVVYNVKLLDNSDPELDVLSDPYDIILANPSSDYDSEDGLMPERRSFRAYTSILYMDPRMKVYIQGKKVRTKRLACSLYKPRLYKYSSNRFRTRSENEAKKAKEEAKIADNRAREAESKAKNLENKHGHTTAKEHRAELRKAQQNAAELRREAVSRKQMAERKTKALKDPKVLNFIFGMNIDNRSHDGVFVYNCSRLIKMYEKVGPQTDGGVHCSGVVGIVDVPYLVLEPTHNKQDFADAKEFRHLMKAMGDHMIQYWKDVNIAQQGITKFWESFGYVSQTWRDPPSSDNKFLRKRSMQINITLQCDLCLKWRTLPFVSNNIGKEFADDWTCSMNPDVQHNKCSASEQRMNIQEGVLRKEGKTQVEKEKKLEEEIKKKQDLLDKIQKTKVVETNKQVQDYHRQKEPEPKSTYRSSPKISSPVRQVSSPQNSRIKSTSNVNSRDSYRSPPARSNSVPVPKSRVETKTVKKNEPLVVKQTVVVPQSNAVRTKVQEQKPITKSTRANKLPEVKAKQESKPVVEEKKTEITNKRRISCPQPVIELEDIVPSKRSKTTVSVNSEPDTSSLRKSKRIVSVDVDSEAEVKKEESKVEEPTITDEKTAIVEPITEINDTETTLEGSMDVEEGTAAVSSDVDSSGDVGLTVQALVNSQWHTGVVTKINAAQGKWKVKFDDHPKDKYDKWYNKSGSDIKLLKDKNGPKADSLNQQVSSPVSSETLEAPSSSTNSTSMTTPSNSTQVMDDIANGYRTCLRYFLPPQWVMDKDSISAMSVSELSSFPLDDFFDQYEKGLRKLVGNFQMEASVRKQEAEGANSKLSSVRKLIAKLLKSINEEFDIDPEADGDQVDELLAACVRQATQSHEEPPK
ncbi:hypothetical protein ScPMuIL_005600 [Solemya velum]